MFKRFNFILTLLVFCASLLQAEMSPKDKNYFNKFTQKKRDINKIKLIHLKRFFPMIGLSEEEAEKVYNQKKKAEIKDYDDLKKLKFSDEKIKILEKYFLIKIRPPEEKKEGIKEKKPLKKKPPEKKLKKEIFIKKDLTEIIEEQEIEDEDAISELQKYIDSPLNINKASKSELMELPDISPLIAVRIIKYVKDNRGFKKIEELKKVEGIDDELFEKIKIYVTVGIHEIIITTPTGEKVKKIEKIKPKIFKGKAIQRIYIKRPMDDLYLSRYTNTYYGKDLSNIFFYNRFDFNFFNHLHIEFMGERDFAEQGLKPGDSLNIKELEIYDMVTWNIYLDKIWYIERIIVGDYKMEIAQGLLFEQGFGGVLLKNSLYKSPVKRRDRGIKPHHSANQSRTLYGAAAQFIIGPVMVFPFFSQKKWDSQLKNRMGSDKQYDYNDNDSDGILNKDDTDVDGDGILDFQDNDIEYSVSTTLEKIIQYEAGNGDYHQTPSEINNRENFTEKLYGGRLNFLFLNQTLNFGGTYYYAQYSHLVDPVLGEFDRFYKFRGRDLNGMSVDYDFFIRNFNFYGEIARSWHTIETWQTNQAHDFSERAMATNINGTENIGYGKIFGMISDFKQVRLSTIYFDLDPNFYSPRANVIDDIGGNIQGFIQGIYGKFSSDLKVWGYAKFKRNKWRSYNLGTLSYDHYYKGGFENRITRRLTFEWQGTYQFQTDEHRPDEKRRCVFRYQLDWKPVKIVHFRVRYENTTVRYPYRNEPCDEEYAYGDVGYAHIKIKPVKRLTIYSRFTYFHTTHFDAAVYVHENGLRFWPECVKSFSGEGYRFFIYLHNKLTKEFSFEIKYGVTHNYTRAMSEILSKHEIKTQIIYKW